MNKSFSEINEKIASGRAVVMTAEEVARLAENESPRGILKKVDVVTTATFGAMCSSGAFINTGHSDPPMRMEYITLNNVEAYAGIAAVDMYLGATQTDPLCPEYGGAHVIEELIKGHNVRLKAKAKGTDCYPRREISTVINKDSINEMIMFNPRNAYQNYPAAINSTGNFKYTYMGTLMPNFGNINYSTSGELSPLLNDPELRTIGLGTRIFFCGAQGYVGWNGTQFNTGKQKNPAGIPTSNAATLSLIGNMKEMHPDYISAAYFEKYGVSMYIGIGIPIPILDEDMARRVSIRNRDIDTVISDYGVDGHPVLGSANYEQLRSGSLDFKGRKIRTAPLSSLKKAREIAVLLKQMIQKDEFRLTEPVINFPAQNELKSLKGDA